MAEISVGNRLRRLILVGSGLRAYREYSLATLAQVYELALVVPKSPTWQRNHVATWRVADTADPAAMLAAVSDLAGGSADTGILTWDEFAVATTADIAERLGLRHMSSRAARACRDKYLSRRLLHQAGLPAVRFRPAPTPDDAVRAALDIGLPVVVKPRSLGGSAGVTLVTDSGPVFADAALRTAHAFAAGAHIPGTPERRNGVLVEEFLDGPEISVDSRVLDGRTDCAIVARKRTGFAPYFEEIGHLVAPWRDENWAGDVAELVGAAHDALGIDNGTTHVEIRLTRRGPRVVEINGRLGGDLIPYLGMLATGIDLPRCAASVAFGERADATPTRELCAEVRFLYPPYDGLLQRLDLSRAAGVPGIAAATDIAAPGDVLSLPPRGAAERLGALVAVAPDEAGCRRALDVAEKQVRLIMVPLRK